MPQGRAARAKRQGDVRLTAHRRRGTIRAAFLRMIPRKYATPFPADGRGLAESPRARGLRLTRPRWVVLEAVRASDAHPGVGGVRAGATASSAGEPGHCVPQPPPAGRGGPGAGARGADRAPLRRQHRSPRPLHLRDVRAGARHPPAAAGFRRRLPRPRARDPRPWRGVLRPLRRLPPPRRSPSSRRSAPSRTTRWPWWSTIRTSALARCSRRRRSAASPPIWHDGSRGPARPGARRSA